MNIQSPGAQNDLEPRALARVKTDVTALPALLLALSCASEAPRAAPVAEPSTEAPAPAEPSRRTAFVEGLPHIRQKPDFCGEACLAMAMTGLGQPTEQDAVFDLTGLDPELGRGAYARDLVIAARALGFEPGQVFYPAALPSWTR